MGVLMNKAWEAFEKAEHFEAMATDASKAENAKRIATRAVDRKLDEACDLEAQALAAGEKHD